MDNKYYFIQKLILDGEYVVKLVLFNYDNQTSEEFVMIPDVYRQWLQDLANHSSVNLNHIIEV